jgi:hypothetical protein
MPQLDRIRPHYSEWRVTQVRDGEVCLAKKTLVVRRQVHSITWSFMMTSILPGWNRVKLAVASPLGIFFTACSCMILFAGGFVMLEGGAFGQSNNLHYVRVNDTTENAFSIEIPQGWHLDGGIFRPGFGGNSFDRYVVLDIVNADRTVRLFDGDRNVTHLYADPRVFGGLYREGGRYTLNMVDSVVKLYVPALEFGRDYLQQIAQTRGRTNFRVDKSQPLSERAPASLGQLFDYWHSAYFSYSFTEGGRPWKGQLAVVTHGMSSVGYWSPELLGYEASEDHLAEAEAAFSHALESIQWNTKWTDGDTASAVKVSQIVTQNQNAIAEIAKSSFEFRQRSWNHTNGGASRTIRGTITLEDPYTHQRYSNQSNRSKYYWKSPTSNVPVGTDTDTPPGPSFYPLNRAEP